MDVKPAWVRFKRPGDKIQITSASGAVGADEMGRARSLLNNAASRQLARFVAASLEGAGNAREKNRNTFFDARLGARGCGLDPPRARRALQARHALDAGGDGGGRGGGAGGLCPSHARRARRSRRPGEARARGAWSLSVSRSRGVAGIAAPRPRGDAWAGARSAYKITPPRHSTLSN